MGRTQNFFFVPHTRHEEKHLFLCKWLNMSFTHLRNIPNEKFFWFFSCRIHHLKFRSKVTECPAKHPLYTSTNKLKRNGCLTYCGVFLYIVRQIKYSTRCVIGCNVGKKRGTLNRTTSIETTYHSSISNAVEMMQCNTTSYKSLVIGLLSL